MREVSPLRAQSWENGKGIGSVGLRTSGMMPISDGEKGSSEGIWVAAFLKVLS